MTPAAWTRYAAAVLEREQRREQPVWWCWYPWLHVYEAEPDGVCTHCGITGAMTHQPLGMAL